MLRSAIQDMLHIVQHHIDALRHHRRCEAARGVSASDDRSATPPVAALSPGQAKAWQGHEASPVDHWLAAATAFRAAAVMPADLCRSPCTDTGENRRLADICRSGDKSRMMAEQELVGSAIIVDLADDYFINRAEPARTIAAILPVISALRQLLADEVLAGIRPELKPAFKQEYVEFQREYIARRHSRPITG